jgi:2'-5' RNA ligase
MYGVIALFDKQTEKEINELWMELKEMGLSTYAFEVEDRRPHVTIASYNSIDEEKLIKKMDDYYNNVHSLAITFHSVCSFFNMGILYYSPIVTTELLRFHGNHHTYFESFNSDHNSMYLPEKWVPHCTIANRITSENVATAYEYCLNRFDRIVGKIEEIAIIKIKSKTKAPIIFSKKLKNERH